MQLNLKEAAASLAPLAQVQELINEANEQIEGPSSSIKFPIDQNQQTVKEGEDTAVVEDTFEKFVESRTHVDSSDSGSAKKEDIISSSASCSSEIEIKNPHETQDIDKQSAEDQTLIENTYYFQEPSEDSSSSDTESNLNEAVSDVESNIESASPSPNKQPTNNLSSKEGFDNNILTQGDIAIHQQELTSDADAESKDLNAQTPQSLIDIPAAPAAEETLRKEQQLQKENNNKDTFDNKSSQAESNPSLETSSSSNIVQDFDNNKEVTAAAVATSTAVDETDRAISKDSFIHDRLLEPSVATTTELYAEQTHVIATESTSQELLAIKQTLGLHEKEEGEAIDDHDDEKVTAFQVSEDISIQSNLSTTHTQQLLQGEIEETSQQTAKKTSLGKKILKGSALAVGAVGAVAVGAVALPVIAGSKAVSAIASKSSSSSSKSTIATTDTADPVKDNRNIVELSKKELSRTVLTEEAKNEEDKGLNEADSNFGRSSPSLANEQEILFKEPLIECGGTSNAAASASSPGTTDSSSSVEQIKPSEILEEEDNLAAEAASPSKQALSYQCQSDKSTIDQTQLELGDPSSKSTSILEEVQPPPSLEDNSSDKKTHSEEVSESEAASVDHSQQEFKPGSLPLSETETKDTESPDQIKPFEGSDHSLSAEPATASKETPVSEFSDQNKETEGSDIPSPEPTVPSSSHETIAQEPLSKVEHSTEDSEIVDPPLESSKTVETPTQPLIEASDSSHQSAEEEIQIAAQDTSESINLEANQIEEPVKSDIETDELTITKTIQGEIYEPSEEEKEVINQQKTDSFGKDTPKEQIGEETLITEEQEDPIEELESKVSQSITPQSEHSEEVAETTSISQIKDSEEHSTEQQETSNEQYSAEEIAQQTSDQGKESETTTTEQLSDQTTVKEIEEQEVSESQSSDHLFDQVSADTATEKVEEVFEKVSEQSEEIVVSETISCSDIPTSEQIQLTESLEFNQAISSAATFESSQETVKDSIEHKVDIPETYQSAIESSPNKEESGILPQTESQQYSETVEEPTEQSSWGKKILKGSALAVGAIAVGAVALPALAGSAAISAGSAAIASASAASAAGVSATGATAAAAAAAGGATAAAYVSASQQEEDECEDKKPAAGLTDSNYS